MTRSTNSPLHVPPELQEAAESVLTEGETLSSFVEQSLRAQIRLRRMQQEFLAKGLASLDQAERSGHYVEVDDVLAELDAMLEAAERSDDKK